MAVRYRGVGSRGQESLLAYRLEGAQEVRLIVSLHVDGLAEGSIRCAESVLPDNLAYHRKVLRERGAAKQPTLMLYRSDSVIEAWLSQVVEGRAPSRYTRDRWGRRVELWKVERSPCLQDELGRMGVLTVADGHHRIESARRAYHNGEAHGWFPAALTKCVARPIPTFQRLIKGGARLTQGELEAAVRRHGRLRPFEHDAPFERGETAIGQLGQWLRFEWNPELLKGEVLEAELFDRLLAPRLLSRAASSRSGVKYVTLSLTELDQALAAPRTTMAVAFPPVDGALYCRRARRGQLLPPKSVCFQDKPEFQMFA